MAKEGNIEGGREVHIFFDGGINPEKIPDLSLLLGDLGINAEIRVETDEPTESVLEIYDGQYNPDLTAKIEDREGYTHQVLNPDNFTPWAKKTGLVDLSTAKSGTQAARGLARQSPGADFTITTESDVFIKASDVFDMLTTVERNPHLIEGTRSVGPRSFESLKQVVRHLVIPNEANEPDQPGD
jgi:hypothetical protein